MTKQELDALSRQEVDRRCVVMGVEIEPTMRTLLAAYWVQGWLAGYEASDSGVILEVK